MDEFMVGIVALGFSAVVLFFLVKLYDHLRYGDDQPQQGKQQDTHQSGLLSGGR